MWFSQKIQVFHVQSENNFRRATDRRTIVEKSFFFWKQESQNIHSSSKFRQNICFRTLVLTIFGWTYHITHVHFCHEREGLPRVTRQRRLFSQRLDLHQIDNIFVSTLRQECRNNELQGDDKAMNNTHLIYHATRKACCAYGHSLAGLDTIPNPQRFKGRFWSTLSSRVTDERCSHKGVMQVFFLSLLQVGHSCEPSGEKASKLRQDNKHENSRNPDLQEARGIEVRDK